MSKLTANGHSTRTINGELISEVSKALKNIRGWGSVEIFVQNNKVVQITERNITKTQHLMSEQESS